MRLREFQFAFHPQQQDGSIDNSFQYLPVSDIVCAMRACRHRWEKLVKKSMHTHFMYFSEIETSFSAVYRDQPPRFCLSARLSQGLPSPPGFLG